MKGKVVDPKVIDIVREVNNTITPENWYKHRSYSPDKARMCVGQHILIATERMYPELDCIYAVNTVSDFCSKTYQQNITTFNDFNDFEDVKGMLEKFLANAD
jgi:hypothetical protein